MVKFRIRSDFIPEDESKRKLVEVTLRWYEDEYLRDIGKRQRVCQKTVRFGDVLEGKFYHRFVPEFLEVIPPRKYVSLETNKNAEEEKEKIESAKKEIVKEFKTKGYIMRDSLTKKYAKRKPKIGQKNT
jgi:hypothetical protein